MTKTSLKIPNLQTRAFFLPKTYNKEANTIQVVVATENPSERYLYDLGRFREILSIDEKAIRLDRFKNGAPLLNNHDRYSGVDKAVIGVVERSWIESNRLIAEVRFSKKELSQNILNDVSDGIVRSVSVGYRVYKYNVTENTEGLDDYIATDWEPFEVSFVPVPDDATAQVRSESSEQTNEVSISQLNTESMAQTTVNNETQPAVNQQTDGGAQNPPVAPEPTPQQRSIDPPANGADLVAAERQRGLQIRQLVETAGLESSVADDLITRGVSLPEAQREIISQWSNNQAPQTRNINPDVSTGADRKVDGMAGAMETALAHRALMTVELTDQARQYRSMPILDMGRELLEANGVNTRGMSRRDLARKVLQTRAYHSTSDFPSILGNTINRRVRASYDETPRTFTPWTTRTTNQDFRAKTSVLLSGLVGDLEKIPEGGEYKHGTMTEAATSYAVEKYGKMIAFTWEMLVNDDLSAFTKIPAAMGAAARQKQSDIIYGILTSNPVMYDGVALFHTSSHGNLASSGGVISVATLSAARAAMRKQKNLEDRFINVMPKFLIVGPDKETEAEQVINSVVVPTTDGTTNPFKNSLQIIVEPRIAGNQWFLAAAPTSVDTIEYAFLEGEGEIFTDREESFDADAVKYKVRMVFGAKALDWRGMYRNPGNS